MHAGVFAEEEEEEEEEEASAQMLRLGGDLASLSRADAVGPCTD
jgi:hypothetical protein